MKRILKVFLWIIVIVVFILGINFRLDIPLHKLKEKSVLEALIFLQEEAL